MIKRSIYRALFILTLGGVAFCASALEPQDLARHLANDLPVAGEFTQAKTLQGFPKPVKSSGVFVFWNGRGLLWETKKPFPNKMIVSQSGLSRESRFEKQTLTVNDNPHIESINRLLMSLMAGDMTTLSHVFEVKLTGSLKSWQLSLIPKDAGLKKLFSMIVLAGGRYTEKLHFEDARGDKTQIHLTNQRVVAKAPEELK